MAYHRSILVLISNTKTHICSANKQVTPSQYWFFLWHGTGFTVQPYTAYRSTCLPLFVSLLLWPLGRLVGRGVSTLFTCIHMTLGKHVVCWSLLQPLTPPVCCLGRWKLMPPPIPWKPTSPCSHGSWTASWMDTITVSGLVLGVGSMCECPRCALFMCILCSLFLCDASVL